MPKIESAFSKYIKEQEEKGLVKNLNSKENFQNMSLMNESMEQVRHEYRFKNAMSDVTARNTILDSYHSQPSYQKQ